MTALETAQRYYDCFNRKDYAGMFALVAPDVRHEVNEGEVRLGKAAFEEFVHGTDRAYDEQLNDMVFFTEPSGSRVAVEFVVHGIYKVASEGLPPAHGQPYILPAGAFLSIDGGLVKRVTTYYNLSLWLQLVS